MKPAERIKLRASILREKKNKRGSREPYFFMIYHRDEKRTILP